MVSACPSTPSCHWSGRPANNTVPATKLKALEAVSAQLNPSNCVIHKLHTLLCNSLHCCSQLLITVVVVCGNDPAFPKSLLLHNLQFFIAATSSNHINSKGGAQLHCSMSSGAAKLLTAFTGATE